MDEAFRPSGELKSLHKKLLNLLRFKNINSRELPRAIRTIFDSLPQLSELAWDPDSPTAALFSCTFIHAISYGFNHGLKDTITELIIQNWAPLVKWLLRCANCFSKRGSMFHMNWRVKMNVSDDPYLPEELKDQFFQDIHTILMAPSKSFEKMLPEELSRAEGVLLLFLRVWYWAVDVLRPSDVTELTSVFVALCNVAPQQMVHSLFDEDIDNLFIRDGLIRFQESIVEEPSPLSLILLDFFLVRLSKQETEALMRKRLVPRYCVTMDQILRPHFIAKSSFANVLFLKDAIQRYLDRMAYYVERIGCVVLGIPTKFVPVLWRIINIVSSLPAESLSALTKNCVKILDLLIGYSTQFTLLRSLRADIRHYSKKDLSPCPEQISRSWNTLCETFKRREVTRKKLLSCEAYFCYRPGCQRKIKATNIKRCDLCGSQIYCSPSCQKVDWERHKPKCYDTGWMFVGQESPFDYAFMDMLADEAVTSVSSEVQNTLSTVERNEPQIRLIVFLSFVSGQIEPTREILSLANFIFKYRNHLGKATLPRNAGENGSTVGDEMRKHGREANVMYIINFLPGCVKEYNVVRFSI